MIAVTGAWEMTLSWYTTALHALIRSYIMSEDLHDKDAEDGTADAIAATAVISLVILTLYLWLSGMPS